MIYRKNTVFHFVGIGGMSMSGLAILLKNMGYQVQGSDIKRSQITKQLAKNKIKIHIGHKKENVENANAVVYNNAISENNPEIVYAKQNNLKLISRGELLGKIASLYKNVISVSGAHGKTTTTAMLSHIFITAKKNPTIHAGGILNETGSNVTIGSNEYFITEACEYKDSFLNLKSTIGLILNVEAEHLDYFKTFENVKKSFNKFAQNSKVLVCQKEFSESAVTYGNDGDYTAKKIKHTKKGCCFNVYYKNNFLCHIKLSAFGDHNVSNALASIAVSRLCGIDIQTIKYALKTFVGTKRRFEILSKKPLVIHDYAHHPSEILSAINTLKKFYKHKIIVLFQPHTYTRTLTLKKYFINTLAMADELIIMKTYPAREKYIKDGSGHSLFETMSSIKSNVKYFESFEQSKKYIDSIINKKTALLIVGAGDIYEKFVLKYY